MVKSYEVIYLEIIANVYFSQNSLSGLKPELMVKIKNKKRLKWVLKQY